MTDSIKKLLRKYKCSNAHYTHVCMGNVRGKYQFDRKGISELWDIYQDNLQDGNNLNIGIAETPQYHIPVLGDIDIKIKEEPGQNIIQLHTQKHCEEVISVYQSVLRTIIEDCTEKHLTCVLLEKPLYRDHKYNNVYVKHGFHIHFPYCFIPSDEQAVHLIPRVKEELKNLETFRDIGIDDSGSVIDEASCKVNWLIYGSSKDAKSGVYKVTKVYNHNTNEVDLEEAFYNYDIFDSNENIIEVNGKVKYYLPRILSIIPSNREISNVRKGLIAFNKVKPENRISNMSCYKKQSVSEALEEAEELLPLLSDKRASNYSDWMSVGWALYNSGEGTDKALDLWCDFSARCEESYNESVCITQWKTMNKTDKGKTIGTIKHYAMTDSPDEYKNLKDSRCKNFIRETLHNTTHNDIAKCLYKKYSETFVCSNISQSVWFEFKDHKWCVIDSGYSLSMKISEEILNEYQIMRSDLYKELAKCDKDESEILKAKLKQVESIMTKLKTHTFKSNVMKEAKELFYNPTFREKLNLNPYIFPFKNGVYDLKANVFRDTSPEDYISKTCAISYNDKISYSDDVVQEVYDFFEKVFPDPSVRKYVMDVFSDLFVGGNFQKHVYFWTGDGDNAKSITQLVLEKLFGELAIKFNTTIITGKKVQSGNANPELARTGGGVRLASLEEPNSDEVINIGILKNLSGNDSYYARDLFEKGKEGREITPMFKLIFICNKLPKLKHSDAAVWNRIRVIPFESTFCRDDNPAPEDPEEQFKQKRFPMDKDFNHKIPGMLQAFAWLLLQHRLEIQGTDRTEPEKVKSATAMYKKQNDMYRQFVEECIISDEGFHVYSRDLYPRFREWFKDSIPNQTLPIKNDVIEHFTKVWGEQERGKKWSGYRLRNIQDEMNGDDAIIINGDDAEDYEADF